MPSSGFAPPLQFSHAALYLCHSSQTLFVPRRFLFLVDFCFSQIFESGRIAKKHPVSNSQCYSFSQGGVPRLLCTKTRYASIAAITHIRFHMCWQIRFALRATTNLGRAANRASAIACGASHLRLKAALQLLHSPTHNSPTFPSVLRGMGCATASPSGFHRPPRHECGFRRTRTRLPRRLHEWGTGKENNSSPQLLTPDPCVLTPNFSCPFVSGEGPHSCPGGAADPKGRCRRDARASREAAQALAQHGGIVIAKRLPRQPGVRGRAPALPSRHSPKRMR